MPTSTYRILLNSQKCVFHVAFNVLIADRDRNPCRKMAPMLYSSNSIMMLQVYACEDDTTAHLVLLQSFLKSRQWRVIKLQVSWPLGLLQDNQKVAAYSNRSCPLGSPNTACLEQHPGCSSTGRKPTASQLGPLHCCLRIVEAVRIDIFLISHYLILNLKASNTKHKKNTLENAKNIQHNNIIRTKHITIKSTLED